LLFQELEKAGIDCPYVTGGGTGTFLFEAGSGIFTEIQPVSLMTDDFEYNQNLVSSTGMHTLIFFHGKDL
jgi:D-serine deaminase-like pyridoxal phosphate-dependent protein